jgi:hypothetical protein
LKAGYNSIVEKERSQQGGFSIIEVTAVLAVLFLIGSAAWQSQAKIEDQKTNLTYKADADSGAQDADGSDPYVEALADVMTSGTAGTEVGSAVIDQLLASYITSKSDGTYSPEYAVALGNALAPMITTELAYQTYSEKTILINPDTSEKASLAYQKALNDALAPLRSNTAPEFEFLALYLETKDPVYLIRLQGVAALYREAASNAATLFVPSDVAQHHVDLLNALAEFGATLDALAIHADNPIESVALLRNYNSGEQKVLTAFNALLHYYAKRT